MHGTCARQFRGPQNITHLNLEHQVPGWVRGRASRKNRPSPWGLIRPPLKRFPSLRHYFSGVVVARGEKRA
jgi:hypothetical protein